MKKSFHIENECKGICFNILCYTNESNGWTLHYYMKKGQTQEVRRQTYHLKWKNFHHSVCFTSLFPSKSFDCLYFSHRVHKNVVQSTVSLRLFKSNVKIFSIMLLFTLLLVIFKLQRLQKWPQHYLNIDCKQVISNLRENLFCKQLRILT